MDTLRQALAESQASNVALRKALAASDEFRVFVTNDCEKVKAELKKTTDALDEYKQVNLPAYFH